jgi:hypothetical protein
VNSQNPAVFFRYGSFFSVAGQNCAALCLDRVGVCGGAGFAGGAAEFKQDFDSNHCPRRIFRGGGHDGAAACVYPAALCVLWDGGHHGHNHVSPQRVGVSGPAPQFDWSGVLNGQLGLFGGAGVCRAVSG